MASLDKTLEVLPPSYRAKDIFEDTLSQFKTRLTPKEQEDFEFVTLQDVRITILRIQRDQDSLKANMNMTRLRTFLEAMDQFSKVIEVFLNVSNFVAFVWGPMKFMLQIASTWTESFESLLDAYEQIGEQIPLLLQYKDLFEHNLHMRTALALMYADILEFHKRAFRFFSGRVWRQIFRSMWKDFTTRFQQLLDGLGRHKQLIAEQASLLHFQQYQLDSEKIRSHIQQYQQDRAQRFLDAEKREEDERQKKFMDVLEWFSATQNLLQDHEGFCAERNKYPKTGMWILKHGKIENWRETDPPVSSTLWINGIPGAGKTILASVIIDACLQDKTASTAYFYCKENDPERNDCIGIYRSILSQLLKQCRELIPYCYDKRSNSGDVQLASTNLGEQLLKLFFEKMPQIYIIIDGLDECVPAQRKLVLAFLTSMVKLCDERKPGKLRVLIISQDYKDIETALSDAHVMSLAASDNDHDIQSFVSHWCRKIQHRFDLEFEHVEYIREATCARAQGMFLFAKLVMNNLFSQLTRKDLLDEIVPYKFPVGLEDAYERIISRVKRTLTEEQWTIVRKLLGWMVCAKRRLKWHEIQAALSIDPDERWINFEDRKLRSHIRDLCGSLVCLLPGDRVELVHNTAKLYIINTGYIRVAVVECQLATLCLQYLAFECFGKDIDPETLKECAIEGSFAFQDYALAKWPHHIRAMVEEKDGVFEDAELQTAIKEVGDALEDFANEYSKDILETPISKESCDACESFRAYGCYENLLYVWSHLSSHDKKGSDARNDVSIAPLGESLIRNRKLLEDLSTSANPLYSEGGQKLTPFYGEKRFKCPKLTCPYFYEGFKDDKSRDKHNKRHDRPFSCTFPGCTIVEFGFTSNKDVEKHMRFFHPEAGDQANMFPAANKQIAESKHACEICGKKFTREFHKKNHIRSHNGERPYSCSECGKAFTRANDCKRHEKIHTRR